jgi:hypothetical protein
MLVAQIHANLTKSRPDLTAAEINESANEGGQWYVMKINNWGDVYS